MTKGSWTQRKSGITIPRPPEFKAVAYHVKAVDDQRGIVEGILNAIGNIDDGLDRTMPGAFKKTLNDSYARKSAQRLEYLWPYLWSHNPEEPPIGGIFDADEVKASGDTPAGLFIKTQLLLDIERARDAYSCFKSQAESNYAGTGLLKQSMGYKAIRYEYVNEKVDGRTVSVRNLLEVQIWEGSAVVFPMNEQSIVTTVKSASHPPARSYFFLNGYKGASGKTTWPLADRATKWDSGQATKDIEAWANGDWSKVAQCFFWVAQSPPAKLEDCKLPFVAKVGGEMQAIPQGIISCAGVIQGAMGGADIPSGDVDAVKAKIATYYKKMDMTPPWEDDGKRGQRAMQRKDFNDHYREEVIGDWLYTDFNNLTVALRQSIIDIFTIGDSPQDDLMNTVLQDSDDSPGFISALQAFVQKGVDLGVSDYLNEIMQSRGCSSGDVMYYMSRGRTTNQTKVGARFSQDTTDALENHVKDMMDMAKQYKSLANQMQTKVSDLTSLWRDEGQGPAYGNDDDGSDNGKSRMRREPSKTLPRMQQNGTQPPQSGGTGETVTLDDLESLIATF